MLCESCGKNPSVIQVKTIVNGRPVAYALCAECARELGYANLLFVLGIGSDNGFTELFAEQEDDRTVQRCSCCGATFHDILRSGKVGCSQCYRLFANQLTPYIQKIHGNVSHRGKSVGEGNLPQVMPQAQLSVMHRELKEAIQSENFEKAAVLRDQIHKMEEGGQ